MDYAVDAPPPDHGKAQQAHSTTPPNVSPAHNPNQGAGAPPAVRLSQAWPRGHGGQQPIPWAYPHPGLMGPGPCGLVGHAPAPFPIWCPGAGAAPLLVPAIPFFPIGDDRAAPPAQRPPAAAGPAFRAAHQQAPYGRRDAQRNGHPPRSGPRRRQGTGSPGPSDPRYQASCNMPPPPPPLPNPRRGSPAPAPLSDSLAGHAAFRPLDPPRPGAAGWLPPEWLPG